MIGALSLFPPEVASDPAAAFRARGWIERSAPDCGALKPGFYEAEAEEAATEFLVTEAGVWSSTPWPEAPYRCRKILQPSLIQEIP